MKIKYSGHKIISKRLSQLKQLAYAEGRKGKVLTIKSKCKRDLKSIMAAYRSGCLIRIETIKDTNLMGGEVTEYEEID